MPFDTRLRSSDTQSILRMGTRDRRPGAPAWTDSSSARDEVHQSALYIDPNVDADRSDPADGCGITVIGTFRGNIRIYHSVRMQMIVQGFKMTAVAAGIKPGGALDLALIHSERPANAAAVFTQNTFIAAPLV